jgi:hypothetical protein
MRHVSTIILEPREESGKRFYVAAGNWNLLGNELGPPDEAAPVSFRLVAGACNALKLPTIRFEFPLIEVTAAN